MWDAFEVGVPAGRWSSTFDHPLEPGRSVECQVLHIPEAGQRLITYCAAPGSPTQAAFRRLACGAHMRATHRLTIVHDAPLPATLSRLTEASHPLTPRPGHASSGPRS